MSHELSVRPNSHEEVSVPELVRLCAVDSELYARTFFAKTVRQTSPLFHREIQQSLAADQRYVAVEVFRDGAKTSQLRLYCSKQIAYAWAHTILFVSNSQAHSVKSLEWLKRNVEHNRKWADVFGLRKGSRWAGEDIEIIHGVEEYPIRVIALGITGQVRGVNVDDYRPDLIVCDDPDNEETTATPEQRKKTSDLFFGALAKSLAPESEAPHAKLVLLQTPLRDGDLISTCAKDPQWKHLRFGCFDESGESSWPARYSTKTLLADKEAHIRRGQLALWMREKECALVPEGGASFDPANLKYWDLLPDKMTYIIAIDPASSSSASADDQVIAVVGFHRDDVYVVEYTAHKGEMPDAAVATLMEYILRYKPLCIVVESVSYQRVLAWYVEQEMKRSRRYLPVHRVQDPRKKADRIIQALGAKAGYGLLHCRTSQVKFIQQFTEYSPLAKMHDDVLDAVSMAIDYGAKIAIGDWIEGEYVEEEDESVYKKLEFRSCP